MLYRNTCCCWRPRQQQRRSGIAEEFDDILAFATTPRHSLRSDSTGFAKAARKL